MSKTYFFLKKIDTSLFGKTVLPDVYCPTGGYHDKNLGKTFTSRGEKFRYLRAHGMREAEVTKSGRSLGGTEGRAIKRSGLRGNFRTRPLPLWMKEQPSHV